MCVYYVEFAFLGGLFLCGAQLGDAQHNIQQETGEKNCSQAQVLEWCAPLSHANMQRGRASDAVAPEIVWADSCASNMPFRAQRAPLRGALDLHREGSAAFCSLHACPLGAALYRWARQPACEQHGDGGRCCARYRRLNAIVITSGGDFCKQMPL